MALPRGRLILGINSAYHESAAAIVRDGEVVCAIEEERITRIKHAKVASVANPDQLPWNAIDVCLRAAQDVKLRDLDAISYSLEPGRRLALIDGDPYEIGDKTGFGSRAGEEEFNKRVLDIPSRAGTRRQRSFAYRTLPLRASSSCPRGKRVLCVPVSTRGSSRGRWDRRDIDRMAWPRLAARSGCD